jgi:hypothetical protein
MKLGKSMYQRTVLTLFWLVAWQMNEELFVATPRYLLWDSYIEIHRDGCKE